MTIEKEELLSAFVDEEISELEMRRLCKGLLSDERELARWGRYHLMRDTLRGNLPVTIDVNFAAEVMAKIGTAPIDSEISSRMWADRLLRPATGFGIAASVAVAAVLGFQSLTRTSSTVPAAAQVAQMSVPAQPAVSKLNLHEASADNPSKNALIQNPEIAARLNSYLVNHSEYAPSQGMMPYARVVVGYDPAGH